MFALLESVWNLLQNSYDTTYLTLGMLLHYLGKLKFKFSADIQQIWEKKETNWILIAFNFASRSHTDCK